MSTDLLIHGAWHEPQGRAVDVRHRRVDREPGATGSPALNRRTVLVCAAAWGAFACAGRALAQAKTPVVIGLLHPGTREPIVRRLNAFREGMAALGWKDGTNVLYEERFADGRAERLVVLAEELVARKAAVIVTGGSPPVAAASKAAPGTPIVMAVVGDPIGSGFVTSLARPGGMITGLTTIAGNITDKYLELLANAIPSLRRVGFLFDSTVLITPSHMESARRSAAQRSIEVVLAQAARPDEIEAALARLAKDAVQALVIMPSSMFATERRRILNLALSHRWPVVAQTHEYAEAGALFSYGADPTENYRRAAYFVDRILKGAHPGHLPIEQPTKFELVVNQRSAKTLGITIQQSVLLQADRVIE